MPNFTLIDGQIKADVWTNGSATSIKGIQDTDVDSESLIDDMMTGVRNAEGYTEVEWTYIGGNRSGTAGPGGNSFNADDILLGHGFATENLDSRLINHDDFLLVNNVGGVPQGPGGTSYLTGYAEAVGLDSSTVDVMNNVISSLQPANEIF